MAAWRRWVTGIEDGPAASKTGRLNGREDVLAVVTSELLDQWQGSLSNMWEFALSEGREISVSPGPRLFEVLEVVVDESGSSASVGICVLYNHRAISTESPDEVISSTEGVLIRRLLERTEGGRIRYVGHESFRNEKGRGGCDISDVHYRLSDPQPAAPTEVPEVERLADRSTEGRSVVPRT